MAVTAKLIAGISFVADPETKARIEAIASKENISMGTVMREVVDLGLPIREAE